MHTWYLGCALSSKWELSQSGTPPSNQSSSMGCLLLRQVPKIWQPLIAAFCDVAESLSTLGVNSFLHWKNLKTSKWLPVLISDEPLDIQGAVVQKVRFFLLRQTGLSPVEPVDGPTSAVRNAWQEKSAGFCPELLAASGVALCWIMAPSLPVFALGVPWLLVTERYWCSKTW